MELVWPRASSPRRVARAHARAEPRSVRALSFRAIIVIGVLALAAITSLLWSAHATRHATHEALRATQGQAHIDEATVALFTHRSLSNLFIVTGEPELDRARDDQAAKLRRLIHAAAASSTDRHERALVELTSRQIDAYLIERERRESRSRDLAGTLASMRPLLDRVTASLAALRELHQQDLRNAYAEISRATVLSDVVGGGLAALLLASLLVMLLGVRRWIVAPLLALHETIERFRRGCLDARAPEVGAHEMRDVAKAYNAMASTLAAQRDGQLTYLAGVAHDLRNPLGAMKMGVTLVDCQEGTEQGRHMLRLLDRQVDRMSRMVEDLLDATRIEAGNLEMKPERVDLVAHARDAIALQAPSFPRHEIVLDAPDEDVVVHVDPDRIDQVVTNLLTNALKFSPGGGRVDVRVMRHGSEAVLEVQDRGIGMTREEMAELFAPFRRRAPEIAPGAGLGLSVARRIVEAQGGRIEVESEPKAGSTFRVVLPAAPAEAESRDGGRADRR